MPKIDKIEGFVKIRDWVPYMDKPLLLKTKHGLREGYWGVFSMGFKLTDCTHPFQNTYLSLYDVTEWKYVNDEDAENVLFIKNTWMRQAEADSILRAIPKKKSFLNQIYQWIIKVIK